MVNIWLLLYMVDIGRNYYLYLLILSPVYKFLKVFLVKIWPRFMDGQLIIRITVKGREGISITQQSTSMQQSRICFVRCKSGDGIKVHHFVYACFAPPQIAWKIYFCSIGHIVIESIAFCKSICFYSMESGVQNILPAA